MKISLAQKIRALKAFYRLYGAYENSDILIDRLGPSQINALCRIVGIPA